MTSIEGLPVALRQLWKEAFRQNKRRPCGVDWDGVIDEAACAKLIDEIELLLLETTRATLLGNLPDEALSARLPGLPGLEICRFHAFGESEGVAASRLKTTESLIAGSDCAAEWKRRFGSWVLACDNATLVDRYALKDHIRALAEGTVSGIWRALEEFSRRRCDRRVALDLFIGNHDVSPAQIGAFESQLYDRLRDAGIRKLRLTVAPDNAFRDFCHHRYMRCDYVVFGLDKGFQPFTGETARDDVVIWQKDRAEDKVFDRSEAALISESLPREFVFQ
ncbi:hypothetical protein [Pararobbsia alpina]|uniref:Uncharacterized protein n=1 Tax=Pararobbsia alpina TaxID=621374 RepID=A0A6S7BM82_9BURK|nr:hypothetical protein [Pararobbsia alpina]CAB3804898.1 hypothetical protein LMG28138_05599 [Pararobbsia alpina]